MPYDIESDLFAWKCSNKSLNIATVKITINWYKGNFELNIKMYAKVEVIEALAIWKF